MDFSAKRGYLALRMGDITTYSGWHEEIKTHRSQMDLSDL